MRCRPQRIRITCSVACSCWTVGLSPPGLKFLSIPFAVRDHSFSVAINSDLNKMVSLHPEKLLQLIKTFPGDGKEPSFDFKIPERLRPPVLSKGA